MVTSSFTKRCRKCGHEKPHGQFHRDARSDDGIDRYCQQCRATYRSLQFSGPLARSMAEVDLIPDDPAAYADRIGRLQRIVDAVDAELKWPRRQIIPTQPGQCPDFVEIAA